MSGTTTLEEAKLWHHLEEMVDSRRGLQATTLQQEILLVLYLLARGFEEKL